MNVKNINVQVLASISNAWNLLRILEMNLWCQSGSDFFDLDFGNWICKKEKEKLYPLFKKMRQRRKVPFLRFVNLVVENFEQGRHFVMHELYVLAIKISFLFGLQCRVYYKKRFNFLAADPVVPLDDVGKWILEDKRVFKHNNLCTTWVT